MVLTLSLVSGIATDMAAPAECPDSEISFESNWNDLVTSQDAFVFDVCPIRILKRMPSNTTVTRDHRKSVFLVVVPPVSPSCYLPSLLQDPDYPPIQVAVTNGSSVK